MAMAVTQPESFTVEIEPHTCDAFKILEHMQKERVLCDVTLVARNVEIPAHKNVLASCSPYFYSMFTNLQTAEQRIIELDMNPQILSSVVTYMYTSKITVIEQDVMDLLQVAKMLLLNGIQVECGNILKRILHPNNCFNIQRIAVDYGDSKLRNSASSYIDDNFMDAVASEEFLNLTSDEMTELISKDTLRMCSEEKVYDCIVRWIKHDPKGRRKHLRHLMGCVRLRFISKEYLKQNVIENSFLKGDTYCKDLIIKALWEEYLAVPKPKPRRYDTKVMLVVGGDGKASNSLEYYDFGKKSWSNNIKIPFSIYGASLVASNQKIYLIGGCRDGKISRTVSCYDINTNSWDKINEITTPRSTYGVGILNSCIYAVGGVCDDILNSAEKFDFQTQKWCPIATMLKKRSLLGVAVLNDVLYAVGGDDENEDALKSVECYNQHTDTWKEVNSMNNCRSVLGVCSLDEKLYAIGGFDGVNYLSSVEVYNPDTDTWTLIAPMLVARGYHDVAVVDNKIYVTGGYNGDSDLNSTEVYDKITNSWTILPDAMRVGRRLHAATIVLKHS